MKKTISMLLVFAMFVSLAPYSFANNDFSVKHGIIRSNDEYLDIDIAYPFFTGFANADQVNCQIRDEISSSIEQAKVDAKFIKENRANNEDISVDFIPTVSLNTTYDYTNNDDILSAQINIDYYSGGAHPINWIYPITINTRAGEILEFKDLFRENTNSTKIISNKIIKEMDKDKDKYFEDYAEKIMDKDGEFEYYIDGNSVVVYFNHYELAPYATGIPSFVLEASEIEDLLKDEVYDSIKDEIKRGSINYNGVDIHSKNKVLEQDDLMIPLRDVAETLGYKVEWDSKNGAALAGGFVKNGVDSYWTKDKDPVSIIAPVVIDGVMYVPLQYFTEVLEENVSFGFKANQEIIVRVYDKDGYDDNFGEDIKE